MGSKTKRQERVTRGVVCDTVAVGNVESQEQALNLLDDLAVSSLWIAKQVLQEARKAIKKLIS